jgi:hypothetical protein
MRKKKQTKEKLVMVFASGKNILKVHEFGS